MYYLNIFYNYNNFLNKYCVFIYNRCYGYGFLCL